MIVDENDRGGGGEDGHFEKLFVIYQALVDGSAREQIASDWLVFCIEWDNPYCFLAWVGVEGTLHVFYHFVGVVESDCFTLFYNGVF